MVRADGYVRKVLLANGIGDILVGLVLLMASGQLAELLGLEGSDALTYLAGGWGVAAISFGLLRLCAGRAEDPRLHWFVAAFGLLEGALLTGFGVAVALATELSFLQVSLSTAFALVFAIAYAIAFALRSRE